MCPSAKSPTATRACACACPCPWSSLLPEPLVRRYMHVPCPPPLLSHLLLHTPQIALRPSEMMSHLVTFGESSHVSDIGRWRLRVASYPTQPSRYVYPTQLSDFVRRLHRIRDRLHSRWAAAIWHCSRWWSATVWHCNRLDGRRRRRRRLHALHRLWVWLRVGLRIGLRKGLRIGLRTGGRPAVWLRVRRRLCRYLHLHLLIGQSWGN